jgi:TonB family protein
VHACAGDGATLVVVRRAVIVLALAIACDRDEAPPADAPPAEPAPAIVAEPVAPAPVVAVPAAPKEAQPHGFAIVRPGATVHLRADDSLPPLKLPAGVHGYAMAVVGSEGRFIAFETPASRTHCGDHVHDTWGLRLRWLVAPEDLLEVTTRRVTADYSDGTKAELLAGVPLRADGDGWIADASGVDIRVSLPKDAVGRYYDPGDRVFVDGPREAIGRGEDQLLYDRTRALDEAVLEKTYVGDRMLVASFAREEKEGRTFAEVRSGCAAIRVILPSSRAKAPSEEALHHAGMLAVMGTGSGSGIIGVLGSAAEPPKPTWYVEPGTTAYWRDGTVGGLVEERRTFEDMREIEGRSCFEIEIVKEPSSRFDLCFDPSTVHESGGASPGELDKPLAGVIGGELGSELGGLGLGGGTLGGVPGGTLGTLGGSAGVPRVRAGTAGVTGSLDKDIIRRIVRAHLNEVRHCYNKGLTKDPGLAGTVTIGFTIDPSGNVSTASVKDDTVPDEDVGKCVAKAVKRWKFPKPLGGGMVVVRYPFTFSN